MATTCKLIAKSVLGSDTASVTLGSIPTTFDDLLVLVSARSATSGTAHYLNTQFNSGNVSVRYLYAYNTTKGSNSTGSLDPEIPGSTSTANTFGSIEIYIPNYAVSQYKSCSVSNHKVDASAANLSIEVFAGLRSTTSAITEISFSVNGGVIAAGSSFYLFGITKA